MATDGGKIKIGKKLYAEQNHSKTCTSPDTLTPSYIVTAVGIKEITIMVPNRVGILITDEYGNADFLPVPDGEAGKNKVLATNSNGSLYWADR